MDTPLYDLMVADYFRLNLRIRSDKTRKQYRIALGDLRQYLGREPSRRDLDDDVITGFVRWLRDDRRLDPRTVNDRRGRINALWRWLADRGQTVRRPTNCPLDVPRKTPSAWTREDLSALMAACAAAPGSIGGVPASVWWLSFHSLAWDTAARTGELLALRWEWFDRSRRDWLRVPAAVRKGNRSDAVYQLHRDTVALLDTIRHAQGVILPLDRDITVFYRLYGELLHAAGLPSDRSCKPQRLRRSHASWLAAAGGDPTASLGHSSPSTTRRSYLDPSIVAPAPASLLPFRLLDLRE